MSPIPASTPRKVLQALLLVPLLFPCASRAAEDCNQAKPDYAEEIARYRQELDSSISQLDETRKATAAESLARYQRMRDQVIDQCLARNRGEATQQQQAAKAMQDCQRKIESTPPGARIAWKWNAAAGRCVNLAESSQGRGLPEGDDCNNASIFTSLKGNNCKRAMNTIRDVKARNSALTDATTAATTAYSNMQATGATGAQNDAQTRQANIMKTLAFSKIATGAINLQGALQLKNAAGGASDANSTITSAQKALQAKCADAADEQVCFYQNAQAFGVEANQASFDRMRRGASQSQEQADAANALAKNSMITGAADFLVGLQALKAAQMANQNAQKLAPPPLLVAPPPPSQIRLGDSGRSGAPPALEPGNAAKPVDYGNPSDDTMTFGPQHKGPINGTLIAGKGGPVNGFNAARSSGLSGGGGVRAGGAGGLRGSPSGRPPAPSRRGNVVGEYNLAGGGPKAGGAGGGEKGDGANPMAEMLSKLFPQDQNGKPIVDTRQIAAAGTDLPEREEQPEEAYTGPYELSIFEQISAKYRQLNGGGRF